MAVRLRALATAVALSLLPAGRAQAAQLDLGLGAGYWFESSGVFDVDLAVRWGLARQLSVGARFGALLATGPDTLGVPLDLQLRVGLGRAWIEGSAGPWILFGADTPARAHASFGFGLSARSVRVGLEVGWLQPNALLALRVAVPL